MTPGSALCMYLFQKRFNKWIGRRFQRNFEFNISSGKNFLKLLLYPPIPETMNQINQSSCLFFFRRQKICARFVNALFLIAKQ